MNKLIGGIILAVVAALVLATITLFVTYVKYSNLGVQYESKLNAVWEENQVVLNTYTAKVQETAQVPDMFKNDLREIVEATFQGRYGEDGSKAVFQFIQEQNMFTLINLTRLILRRIGFLKTQRKISNCFLFNH